MYKPKFGIAVLLAMFTLIPGQVMSHHSIAGQFNLDTEVQWTGVVSDMDWINPHSYVYLDVANEDGSVTTWKLETLPTAMLRKAGITKALLSGEGQQVTVTGHTARDGTSHLGFILRIDYEDGHFYKLW